MFFNQHFMSLIFTVIYIVVVITIATDKFLKICTVLFKLDFSIHIIYYFSLQ